MTEPPKPPTPGAAASKPDAEQPRPGGNEVTVDLVRPAAKPAVKVVDLLPPGATSAEAATAKVESAPQPPAPPKPPSAAATAVSLPVRPVQMRRLSPEQRAERRFWKNAIMFGFFVVVLVVVFYVFSR